VTWSPATITLAWITPGVLLLAAHQALPKRRRPPLKHPALTTLIVLLLGPITLIGVTTAAITETWKRRNQ